MRRCETTWSAVVLAVCVVMASGCAKLSAKAEEVAPKVGLGVKLPPALVVEITEDSIFVDDTSIMKWLSERLPEEDRETMLEVFAKGRIEVVSLKGGELACDYLVTLDEPGHGKSLDVLEDAVHRTFDAVDFALPDKPSEDARSAVFVVDDLVTAQTMYFAMRSVAHKGIFQYHIALGHRGTRAKEVFLIRLPTSCTEPPEVYDRVRAMQQCHHVVVRMSELGAELCARASEERVERGKCDNVMRVTGDLMSRTLKMENRRKMSEEQKCRLVRERLSSALNKNTQNAIDGALMKLTSDASPCRDLTVLLDDEDTTFAQLAPVLRVAVARAERPRLSRLLKPGDERRQVCEDLVSEAPLRSSP